MAKTILVTPPLCDRAKKITAMKKHFNALIGIALGLIFLFLWIRIVDWQQLIWYFKTYNLSLVPLFSLFYIFAYFLRSWRWLIILKPEYKMKRAYSFKVFMTGMLINYLIPVRAGELTKSIILKNKDRVPISRSLPSIFIDKLTDLFPIILIIILMPLLTLKINSLLMTIIILLLLIYLAFLIFLFFTVNHQETAKKILSYFRRLAPQNWQLRLDEFFNNFIQGMAIMKGRLGEYFLIYLLTLGAVFSEAFYVYFIFRSFGSEATYLMILFGYTLMNLTYILPTPPAQIGSNQFMWVLIFSFALGINKDLTSAAVIFSHLITSFWIFCSGIISLLALKIRFNELVSGNNDV
jgi:uncharacterized protein (TIRG00374 family)